MKVFLSVIVLFAVALGGAGKSYADSAARQGYFTIMGSYVDDDDDRAIDDTTSAGQLGFGYSINENWNLEALYQAARPDGDESPLTSDQRHVGIGLDVQRVFRRASRFSPYLHVGVGDFDVKTSGAGGTSDSGRMYSYGAGFLFDLGSSNVALRAEWRQRADNAGLDHFTDNLFSLGFQMPFGDAAPKVLDGDNDGVVDGIDLCPNTPAGTPVDAYGCERDSDADGVKDSMDRCPGTPIGVQVDANGCPRPIDSDGDGVTDDNDRCPGTPRGAKVDQFGCELDTDKDGVVDRLDDCPNSAPGVQVDVKGCEIKEEIRLPGVNFESNSDRLVPGAESVLADAAATLKKNPSIRVEVAGHTDSDGSAEHNEGLSARRATTVRDYLAASGISVGRMTVRGYGESLPIADNSTSAGKATNRRVVLRITDR